MKSDPHILIDDEKGIRDLRQEFFQKHGLHASIAADGVEMESALRRCITNLINNAVIYGKRVHLDLRQEDRNNRLTIRDEGPGIVPEQFEHVLRPFVRMEASRSRATGGSGIGLTIARNIARGLGGDIRLSNHPLGGLCVELTLPAIPSGA